MVAKSLYLPKELIDQVDRYAAARRISRNVAFEELLALALKGPEKLPISFEMMQAAFKDAGLDRNV